MVTRDIETKIPKKEVKEEEQSSWSKYAGFQPKSKEENTTTTTKIKATPEDFDYFNNLLW